MTLSRPLCLEKAFSGVDDLYSALHKKLNFCRSSAHGEAILFVRKALGLTLSQLRSPSVLDRVVRATTILGWVKHPAIETGGRYRTSRPQRGTLRPGGADRVGSDRGAPARQGRGAECVECVLRPCIGFMVSSWVLPPLRRPSLSPAIQPTLGTIVSTFNTCATRSSRRVQPAPIVTFTPKVIPRRRHRSWSTATPERCCTPRMPMHRAIRRR